MKRWTLYVTNSNMFNRLEAFSYTWIIWFLQDILLYKVKPKWSEYETQHSLRSWQDFARECFCVGSEAVNACGEAVKGFVKSRVEFPPAQIRGVFLRSPVHANFGFAESTETSTKC